MLQAITTSIVVCVRDSPNWTRKCLAAVTQPSTPHSEVIIVDDGSHWETRCLIDRIAAGDSRVTTVRPSSRQWFPAAANLGVRTASGDCIILLNSDATPNAASIALMSQALDELPTAFIGPLSNAGGFQSVPWTLEGEGAYPVCEPPAGHSLEDVASQWMDSTTEGFASVAYLNGFCMAFRRERFLDLGGFDTDSFPFGYGEEIDLCLRHLGEGGSNLVATHVYVPHAKTQSYTAALRSKLVQDARVTLAERYGRDFIAACRSSIRSHPDLIESRRRVGRLYEVMAARMT